MTENEFVEKVRETFDKIYPPMDIYEEALLRTVPEEHRALALFTVQFSAKGLEMSRLLDEHFRNYYGMEDLEKYANLLLEQHPQTSFRFWKMIEYTGLMVKVIKKMHEGLIESQCIR